MEDKKFYVPTIEEFHVGFECENKVITPKGEKWVSVIIDEHSIEVALSIPGLFRVKYLDRELVETVLNEVKEEKGIDWIIHQESPDATWYNTGSNISVVFVRKNRRVMIEVANVHGELGNNAIVFNLCLKNISEFRKVYNQAIKEWRNE